MSDTEESRERLSAELQPDWKGPVILEDLRHACCAAHGSKVQDEQPCMWLHNVLTASECEYLLRACNEHHETGAGGYSTDSGVRSQFTSLDANLSALLWDRISPMLPAQIDGGTAVGPMVSITYARYLPGQSGFPHMDFRHGHRRDPTIASRVSFTCYLNDDYEGGELSFVSRLHEDGTASGEHSTVKPRLGSAVLFYQGAPQFAHLPHTVTRGSKEILRADIMYRFESADAADVGGLRVGRCRNASVQ